VKVVARGACVHIYIIRTTLLQQEKRSFYNPVIGKGQCCPDRLNPILGRWRTVGLEPTRNEK